MATMQRSQVANPPQLRGNPFDPKAAALCGQFVQAAYTMYAAAPNNLTPSQSNDFPPGYQLVAWIQMRDFIIGSTGPLFYGFVAQSVASPDRFVLAIRGTSNGIEWWDDANAAFKVPFKVPESGSVGMGFARIYDTLEVVLHSTLAVAATPQSLRSVGGFSEQISTLLTTARTAAFTPLGSIQITGHSLGAALATLYTLENARSNQISTPLICTFASPLVGDATFAAAFNELNLTSWRIVNAPDVVPKLPPEILGFRHIESEQLYNSAGTVRSLESCWHALSTYLSLVDPTQQPGADCLLTKPVMRAPLSPSIVRPPAQSISTEASSTDRSSQGLQLYKPFVIDLYQGDNVQDTPGPLGGFARTKASGIAFLIHKASEGLTEVDSRYQARRRAWMDGIAVPVTDVDGEVLQLTPRFAAYHFFHGQDPEAEARHFLATAQLQPGDDAVIDWEAVGASGYEPSADAVDAFCNVVEARLGFPIIVYSGNVAKAQLKGKDARFAKRRLWLASYGRTFTVQDSWELPWLWQDDGDQFGPGPNSMPGIDGYCDNSTIVAPMTIKRLYAEWGGGGVEMAKRGTPKAQTTGAISVWEDDPGSGILVSRPVPDVSRAPLGFSFPTPVPQPGVYKPGTPGFRYWTAAEALRRGADFWANRVPLANWQTGQMLRVLLDEGSDLNAYYDRQALNFFHGASPDGTVYSGESPDVVCHEMGHAVLDSFKPELWNVASHEAAAFHESFGDISAILSALQLPSLRAAILSDTGGHLYQSSRLSRLAEQLGAAIRSQQPDAVEPDCLRNAVNSFSYDDPIQLPPVAPASQLSSEAHSFSRVFTGAFFEALGAFLATTAANAGTPTEQELLSSANDLAAILVTAVKQAPVVSNFYAQVAAHMVEAAGLVNLNYVPILKGVFTRRSILSLQSAAQVHVLQQSATALAALPPAPHGALDRVALPAVQYGLDEPLLVDTPSNPRKFLATASAADASEIEPASAISAARGFVDDLFRRGRVLYGDVGRPEARLEHGRRLRSHKLIRVDGGVHLIRVLFDCGLCSH